MRRSRLSRTRADGDCIHVAKPHRRPAALAHPVPVFLGLPPDRRRQQLGRLNGAFRGSSRGRAGRFRRPIYFGRVRANPSHRVETIYGQTIDQLDELDECWIGPPGADKRGSSSGASAEAGKTRNWSVPASPANTCTSNCARSRPATSVAASPRTPQRTCSAASCSPHRRPHAMRDGPIGTTASTS